MTHENPYNPAEFEPKWIRRWEEEGVYQTPSGEGKTTYVLGMFPYPSGAGLHTGHVRIYTATDVIARFLRMRGYKVLFPMGWDAFGLPAENAAIKAKTNPVNLVPGNQANFKRQMQMMGLGYDWDREFSTTDPEYYRWTQWLFLKLYSIKNKKGERLVYRKEVPINWCPFCKTGLANEEVLPDGTHERCGTAVEQKNLPQWNFRITDYADRLLNNLIQYDWVDEDGVKHDKMDWPEGILAMQRNWIGKNSGARVKFKLQNTPFALRAVPSTLEGTTGVASPSNVEGDRGGVLDVDVFTTRLDTIFGVSFISIAPELAKIWLDSGWTPRPEVREYVENSLKKLEQTRLEEAREKTGVLTEITVTNPVNGEALPVWVADYVLGGVGTGAVMGVPAHDQRDFEFAEKFGLPIKEVIVPVVNTPKPQTGAFEPDGILINSEKYDDLSSEEARTRILEDLKTQGVAQEETTYHMRDWVFSRQRYWGEPIPVVYCDKCGDENGVVPLSEDQLPLELPYLESYEPSGTGESPLAAATDWVNTTCPKCGGPAHRETDTMPNWAGSCWYFLRFADPHNSEIAWSNEDLHKWLPVKWYLGGAEHAVLHLLYARFWTMAFKDLGLLNFEEPFVRLRSVGMVLAEDGRKMSKSWGNVVNPDDAVRQVGVDALRIYEMFMGPWDQAIAWDTRSLVGCRRFVEKVWKLAAETIEAKKPESDTKLHAALQKLVSKVGRDIPEIKFNTSVAALMEFTNAWGGSEYGLTIQDLKVFLQTLAPLAPFMADELWRQMGEKESIHLSVWPVAEQIEEADTQVVIQVNGKFRGTLTMPTADAKLQDKVVTAAKSQDSVSRLLSGGEKIVFVPGRLVNFVVS